MCNFESFSEDLVPQVRPQPVFIPALVCTYWLCLLKIRENS